MNTQGKLPFQDPPNARNGCATTKDALARDLVEGIDRKLPNWLGLVTSHRRLLDASQDGWMRPPPRSSFLLGHESFVTEQFLSGRNTVPIRLAFDVCKLPFPDVRKDLECDSAGSNEGDGTRAVRWRAPDSLVCSQEGRSFLHRAQNSPLGDGRSVLQRLFAGS